MFVECVLDDECKIGMIDEIDGQWLEFDGPDGMVRLKMGAENLEKLAALLAEYGWCVVDGRQ